MDSTDQYFTRTIVGPPRTLVLGRRHSTLSGSGSVLDKGKEALRQAWEDNVVLQRTDEVLMLPRRVPGPVRRWLERHALVVASVGLLALAAAFAGRFA